VVFFFILFYPILYVLSRRPQRYFSQIVNIRRIIALFSTLMSGFMFRFHYKEKVDWTRTYVICANHTSLLDISIMAILCRQNFCFIGKESLLKNPVTRIFFRTIDIPINRESKLSSYRAFKTANERLKEGKSIAIFPEGKIEEVYPPRLQDFKNGPFRLAIENKLPILPLVMHDIWKLLWDEGNTGSRPGLGRVSILPVVETENLTINDIDTLKDQIFSLFSNHLRQSM